MDSPYAIHIRCDGSMDYDSRLTGGFGFRIEFPDSTNLSPIEGEVRADGQGIHRLELMAVLKGMNELLRFQKINQEALKNVSGVTIHSDRYSISDNEINNPYRIQGYRKNKWKTYEKKPVKHDELLDAIDKARKKINKVIPGRIEIVYTPEKKNRAADKLSKKGKLGTNTDKTLPNRMPVKVGRRLLTGSEVKYNLLSKGEVLDIHPFYTEQVQEEYEIRTEILDGRHTGNTLKIYASAHEESKLHRFHFYQVEVKEVKSGHVRVDIKDEVTKKYKGLLLKTSNA